jgi:hypothetical protein
MPESNNKIYIFVRIIDQTIVIHQINSTFLRETIIRSIGLEVIHPDHESRLTFCRKKFNVLPDGGSFFAKNDNLINYEENLFKRIADNSRKL